MRLQHSMAVIPPFIFYGDFKHLLQNNLQSLTSRLIFTAYRIMCDNSVQKNNKEKQKQKKSPTHQDYLHQKCLSCKCKHSLLVFILPPLYFLNSHQPNTFHKTDKYIFFFKTNKKTIIQKRSCWKHAENCSSSSNQRNQDS